MESFIDVLTSQEEKLAIFLDEGFANIFKWTPQSVIRTCEISLMNMSQNQKNRLTLFDPHHVLFFMGQFDTSEISRILSIFEGFSVVTILTSTAVDNLPHILASLAKFISSAVTVSWFHLPLHCIPVLASDQEFLGLNLLSSPSIRGLRALTLTDVLSESERKLSNTHSSSFIPITSINSVTAEDIPLELRSQLKALAAELAATLVFNLGLDISNSVFALGKTSSLLGHTIQPIVASLIKLRSDTQTSRDHHAQVQRRLYTAVRNYYAEPSFVSEDSRKASLLLVDRTVDLLTPLSHDGAGPLAHRILCTVLRQQSENGAQGPTFPLASPLPAFDLSLLQPSRLAPPLPASSPPQNLCDLHFAFSAVSGVAIASTPSLYCCRPLTHSSQRDLCRAMYTLDAERGRSFLKSSLLRLIDSVGGSPPPNKKRGLGAEMLALVSAVGEAVAGNGSTLYGESSELLGWSVAVVEAMQRSSSKQMEQHLRAIKVNTDVKSTFEFRAARESSLLKNMQTKIRSEFSLEINLQILVQSYLESLGLSEATNPGETQLVDVEHAICLATRAICLLSHSRVQGKIRLVDEFLNCVATRLAMHIVHHSHSPIEQLADWGLLSKQDEGKIERCRQAHLESDKGEAVVELVQLCIHSRLSVLRELVNSEIGSVDKDGSKLDERIYDMLGYPGLHVDTNPEVLVGVIPRIVSHVLGSSSVGRDAGYEPVALEALGLKYVEDPVAALARAGLGLFERFGFKSVSSVTSPSDLPVVVLFVVGGLSLIEVMQIQAQLTSFVQRASSAPTIGDFRVILCSNRVLSPDDVYFDIFRANHKK